MASFLAMLVTLMACFFYSSFALNSKVVHVQFSTISAAPAFLPEAPLSAPDVIAPPPTQSLSPDIEPVLPKTRAAAPSPSDMFPTIPSSPSPPNPDIIEPSAPGPVFGISPSGSLPVSSAICLSSSTSLHFLGLLVLFCLMQLSAL